MLGLPMVMKESLSPNRLSPGDILGGGENILAGGISTVGAGTWTGAAIATGIIRRTGPTAGYTDTTDSAANIIAALGGNIGASGSIDGMNGTSFRLLLINTVAFALTFAAGAGVVSGTGTLGVSASAWREYLVTVLNTTPSQILSCGTTNGSAVVTFNLPVGMAAFPIGPAPNAVNITPGASVSGTGVAAGATVIGLTFGQGGITGVTLSANATATNAAVALTFGPTVQFDSLRAGTL